MFVWNTKFFDEDKLTLDTLATDEDNFDSSSLFRFKNDPQECYKENQTIINYKSDLVVPLMI